MSKGNTYKCVVCGRSFQFCPKCQITKPSYDPEFFCSRSHADIFAILSKHGCHLATTEETLAALKDYDTTGLTESIQAHIDSLQPKTEAKTDEIKVESKKEVETVNKKRSFRTQE